VRALLVDRSAPGGLRLGQAPDPDPAPDEALVRVTATSLNFGEVKYGVANAPDATVLGWDAAGIVEMAAADGSGPAAGTPVITLAAAGAWAELRAVPAALVGAVPAGADLGAISTVPVAGASARRALHRLGPILGRRVLVTGATGGVGRYAVQLAHLGGAWVAATTGDPDRHGDALRALGADEVLADPADLTAPVDGVVDMVGGPHLVTAYARLGTGGTLVSVGHATGRGEEFPPGAISGVGGHDRSVTSFYLMECPGLRRDLEWLADAVTAGRLDPQISWRGSWGGAADAVAAMVGRRLHGKAVLEIG
jgi:NADPH:quinone reductase-like Zn-dependent oxidoreductase